MKSEIKTYTYPDQAIERVQIVHFDRFEDLHFYHPDYDPGSFEAIATLYRDYIVRKYANILGTVIIYHVPDGFLDEELSYGDDYGTIYEKQMQVNALFRKNIGLRKGRLYFRNDQTKRLFERLQAEGLLMIAKGKRKFLSLVPVGNDPGYLSKEKEFRLKVNGSFFVFDLPDLKSPYDVVGSPFGLCIKDGQVLRPPLFDRETLIVYRDGKVQIRKMSLNDVTVIIDGKEYRHGKNACFFSRPEYSRSPAGGHDLVIINDRVVAEKNGGNTPIPSGGFILKLSDVTVGQDHSVSYGRMDEIVFAIQGGNSAIIDGVPVKGFISSFYNIFHFWKTSFPPSLYPLHYQKDRAPRIVLGADKEGKPMLLWFEGAGKFGYQKGKESAGASLKEAAEICKDLGMVNGIHLDGGGSAQILLNNERSLKIADRDPITYNEIERAVPSGLYVK